ncbi:uracil-DNA glycosylase family protein [Marinivivus vitaminiproducens]|uniref:uracil-DNA glycosylase family protein n=1 Tax=Marinivivus vitaminiproducens TaxID=3035935 RepID=UPI0027A50848|nr:uracil-DNA glycosylase family protein [Geminicoccaceae bacterium SCSIO 64248]
MRDRAAGIDRLAASARACTLCADRLPHAPRPVLRVHGSARLLIVGQAPGARVHASGLPFDDPSGVRLRRWLGVTPATFYDATRIAFLPAALCYPGTDARGADRPPPPVCARTWQPPIVAALPHLQLILLVGGYAQAYHLGTARKPTLAGTVEAYADYGPRFWPIPHPSWRCNGWLKRHPWFEAAVVPKLQDRVASILQDDPALTADES